MRLSFRSHIILVIGLLVATFGIGQILRLALFLRENTVSFGDLLAGGLGLLLLMVAGLIVGRLLYLQSYISRSYQTQKQEVYNDSRK